MSAWFKGNPSQKKHGKKGAHWATGMAQPPISLWLRGSLKCRRWARVAGGIFETYHGLTAGNEADGVRQHHGLVLPSVGRVSQWERSPALLGFSVVSLFVLLSRWSFLFSVWQPFGLPSNARQKYRRKKARTTKKVGWLLARNLTRTAYVASVLGIDQACLANSFCPEESIVTLVCMLFAFGHLKTWSLHLTSEQPGTTIVNCFLMPRVCRQGELTQTQQNPMDSWYRCQAKSIEHSTYGATQCL